MLHPPLTAVHHSMSPPSAVKLLGKFADQQRAYGLPLPQTEMRMRRNTASMGFRVAQSPHVLARRTAASSLQR